MGSAFILALVVGGLTALGQPTESDLGLWAIVHWSTWSLRDPQQVLATFEPTGAQCFMGTNTDGFYRGEEVGQAWAAFFRDFPVGDFAGNDSVRTVPEARTVFADLKLRLRDGRSLDVYSALRFSETGKVEGADLIVYQGTSGPAPVVDGRIGAQEYRRSARDSASGVEFSWRNGLVVLVGALRSPGTGWVSVGFDPVRAMQGANYIIAAVSGAQLVIEDHFGTGATAHRPDAKDHIFLAAGAISGGTTVVEFIIPLDSKDPEDKPLKPKTTYTVLLAYNRTSTSFTVRHTARGSVRIELEG